MTSQIDFARLARLIRRIGARSLAATRNVATRGVQRKKIQRIRNIIEALPDTLPYLGPDLIMGCACGYQIDSVRPFVESLFDSGQFRGEAVIFVGAEDKALAAFLESIGVKVFSLGIEKNYPVFPPKRARYFAYFKYLHDAIQSGRTYRNILLSDVRDVIFQRPLFETPASELELYYELRSVTIGTCQFNSYWINEQFGKQALASLADRRISCCGTVSGRARGILEYLAEMQIILLTLLPKVRMTNGDQGAHNYLLHNGLLPEAKVLENFGRVATLHHVPSKHLHVNAAGHVINPDGSISEIVHQYDRHPHLFSAIQKSFNVKLERLKLERPFSNFMAPNYGGR
jgi:hypothetical protein